MRPHSSKNTSHSAWQRVLDEECRRATRFSKCGKQGLLCALRNLTRDTLHLKARRDFYFMRQMKNCSLRSQLSLQNGNIDLRNRRSVLHSQGGSSPRGLANHHVLWLHADRGVGHVRGRQAYRNQQIVCLISPRQNCPVRNLVWLHRHLNIAFVADSAVRRGDSLNVM